jgi:hypothetical protein
MDEATAAGDGWRLNLSLRFLRTMTSVGTGGLQQTQQQGPKTSPEAAASSFFKASVFSTLPTWKYKIGIYIYSSLIDKLGIDAT